MTRHPRPRLAPALLSGPATGRNRDFGAIGWRRSGFAPSNRALSVRVNTYRSDTRLTQPHDGTQSTGVIRLADMDGELDRGASVHGSWAYAVPSAARPR